jgi:hypothetical protein
MIREFGSEFDWSANQPFLGTSQQDPFKGWQLLRSGRDGLRLIAEQCRPSYETVVLPALCCQSMVNPFLQNGYNILWYTMDSKIHVSSCEIERYLSNKTILLNLNYFGKPLISADDITALRQKFPETLFLLDDTQTLVAAPAERDIYDFTVVSIRKWFAIPDGGAVRFRTTPASFRLECRPEFAQMRRNAMQLKSNYLQTGTAAEKVSYRKLLAQATHLIDTDTSIAQIDSESEEIIHSMDYAAILQKRSENCAMLSELLKDSTLRTLPERTGGLYFPVLTEKRDQVQRKLAGSNIYCPVIWPLPIQCTEAGETERLIECSMLAIPCDQRYNKDDMVLIANTVISVLKEVSL